MLELGRVGSAVVNMQGFYLYIVIKVYVWSLSKKEADIPLGLIFQLSLKNSLL